MGRGSLWARHQDFRTYHQGARPTPRRVRQDWQGNGSPAGTYRPHLSGTHMSYALYQRDGSPFWFYDLTIDGIRERKSTKTASKKLAAQVAAAREAELVRASLYGPESVVTFGHAVGLYLAAGKSDLYLPP